MALFPQGGLTVLPLGGADTMEIIATGMLGSMVLYMFVQIADSAD
jgi:hypothetical protein